MDCRLYYHVRLGPVGHYTEEGRTGYDVARLSENEGLALSLLPFKSCSVVIPRTALVAQARRQVIGINLLSQSD